MEYLNNFYSLTNPIAFEFFGFKVHWYGLCYVFALLVALYLGKRFARQKGISDKVIDNFFIWVEIGVILGARLGYILVYDVNTIWYLTHPWQIFNPFVNGEFVGIRGMSYHGAMVGFLISCVLFAKKYKVNLFKLLDICALAIPFGYIFGRIGNFLNHELFGRETDVSWAVDVNGIMRHPSQLYEAFSEGLLVFLLVFFVYKKFKPKDGILICIYGIGYSLSRFVCEFFREPDSQLGFVFSWLSMGQILSIFMFVLSLFILIYIIKKNNA